MIPRLYVSMARLLELGRSEAGTLHESVCFNCKYVKFAGEYMIYVQR